MCKFKSYVVTKDLKVRGYWCARIRGTDQNAILMREHVKIEVTPTIGNFKTAA